jgi:hypothetical protein
MKNKTQSITGITVKGVNWNSAAQMWQGYYWAKNVSRWKTMMWNNDGKCNKPELNLM